MSQPLLRYSDRQRLAEAGSLGDLNHDSVPVAMRNAIVVIVRSMLVSNGGNAAANAAEHAVSAELAQHFGLPSIPALAYGWFEKADLLDFLDGVEILCEQSLATWTLTNGRQARAFPDFIKRFNRLAYRHRFGYQLDENGRIRRIGSEALDRYVAGPALQAVRRPGWEEVERTYREALDHQRGGPAELDDALTAANAAVEAAMKAAGLSGTHLGQLAKSLRSSDLVPGSLKAAPEALGALISSLQRQQAMRDEWGDAHGNEPGAEPVPQELADLAIYWAGAFINYLAAADERRQERRS